MLWSRIFSKKKVNYEIKPYLGNEKEDDWGFDLAITNM
jgi:hypothetical protein